ncbi:kinase-like protein [Aureobasidium sp. EXF-8845]|nr:kinase-like protein [Aureobasidium sp. EXF-8845]KAI4856447.1 kinase-like protein [Aureobasidium sp. EXF-8846]
MPLNLTFLERFETISKVQAAFGLHYSELSSGEFQDRATSLEQSAFDESEHLVIENQQQCLFYFFQDYQSRTDAVIRDLSLNSSLPEQSDEPVEDVFVLPIGGVTIGRYTNAIHHSDGLFSEVYKAVAPSDCGITPKTRGYEHHPCLIALKVTNPSAMEPPHDSVREVRLLERARHQFVIELVESFQQSGGRLVLAFPFMPYTLDDQLRKGSLQPRDQKIVLSGLMQGLEHIHSCGIIHRDIKPSNILLRSPSGPVYISDFGIAWSADDASSEPAREKIMDVGTTSYRPPELMFGNQWYNTSLDMWAAGCVVAQVVSLGSQTLFDSGDLGSDLALIKSIFSTLGTPNLDSWPEARSLPDWGKMAFVQYPPKSWTDILPSASADTIELVQRLVTYESGERMKADEWREHSFFKQDTSP